MQRLAKPHVFEGLSLFFAAPFLMFPSLFSIGTVLALLLLILDWVVFWHKKRRPLCSTPLNGALLIFYTAVCLGLLVTADGALTLPKATGLVLAFAVWRYFALYINSNITLNRSLYATVTIFIALAAIGVVSAEWSFEIPVVQQILGILPTKILQLPSAPEVGVSRNQLAGTIVSFLPFLAAAGFARHQWGNIKSLRFVFGALTIAFFALLVATQSRSAWLGIGLGLGFLLMLWIIMLPPSRKRLVAIVALLSFAFICVGLFIGAGPAKIIQVWQSPPKATPLGDFSTLDFRKEVWRWALIVVQDFPFTGCGLGTFRVVVRRFYPLAVQHGYDIAHAHNIFLQIALDIGLPGLIAYLALLMIALIMGWRVARRDKVFRPWALGILGGLIAQHGFGLTDALSLGSKPGLIFWLFLGMLTAMTNAIGETQSRSAADVLGFRPESIASHSGTGL